MSKKTRPKKKIRKSSGKPAKQKPERYTAGEISIAVLGAAILVMIAGIIITSLLD